MICPKKITHTVCLYIFKKYGFIIGPSDFTIKNLYRVKKYKTGSRYIVRKNPADPAYYSPNKAYNSPNPAGAGRNPAGLGQSCWI